MSVEGRGSQVENALRELVAAIGENHKRLAQGHNDGWERQSDAFRAAVDVLVEIDAEEQAA